MKNYLNKNERENIVMLTALLGFVQDIFQGWADRGSLTKNETTRLRSATTHLSKMVDSVIGRLDSGHVRVLLRDARNSKIFCLPTERADIKLKNFKEERSKETAVVNLEALNYIAEKALYHCSPCTEKDESCCVLRNCFTLLAIPVFDVATKGCPYKLKEEVAG
jgi:hypothetical protein